MPRQVSWALAAALVLALAGRVWAQQTPPDPGAAEFAADPGPGPAFIFLSSWFVPISESYKP